MNTTLIEWHYWPCIAYFQKIMKSDVISITSEDNFERTSFINKCIIASANGPLTLRIPIKGGSRKKQKVKQVEISYDTKWQREHWYSIQSAYAKSAFFEYYESEIQQCYLKKEEFLVEWNKAIVNWVLKTINYNIILNEVSLDENEAFEKLNINPYNYTSFKTPKYYQLFESKNGYLHNLSILDLIMSVGPNTINLLKTV